MKYYLFLLIVFSLTSNAQNFEKAIEKTTKSVENFQDRNKIPGIAVSISYKDKLIYSKGFGTSNIETKEPINPSKTKFRIASMTKSLTALTIGKLMEMDSIDINKSVYYYLKKLPKKNFDFTIKDVGGHLS